MRHRCNTEEDEAAGLKLSQCPIGMQWYCHEHFDMDAGCCKEHASGLKHAGTLSNIEFTASPMLKLKTDEEWCDAAAMLLCR